MDDETEPTATRSERAVESGPTERSVRRTVGDDESTREVGDNPSAREAGDDEPPPECGIPPDRDIPTDDAATSDEDADEPLEYRLERLRLWRAVVTLAIVIGRLIRSV